MEKRVLDLVFNEGCRSEFVENYRIVLECEGRQYDPSTECYHPQYKYVITGPKWEYVGNDIFGAANGAPDTLAGMKALIAFLIHAQSGMPEDSEYSEADGAEQFPSHVREFAYLLKEQLEMHYALLESESEENKNAGTS